MTVLQRVQNVFAGIVMILAAVAIVLLGGRGYILIADILSLSLTLNGASTILYYAVMARHMVDGRYILYKGVILLDLGIFTLSLQHYPAFVVVLYLIGALGFTGIVAILRARESREYGGSWKLKTAEGALNLGAAVLALAAAAFFGSLFPMGIVYALGLVSSAVLRIISAFRKTAIVYVA